MLTYSFCRKPGQDLVRRSKVLPAPEAWKPAACSVQLADSRSCAKPTGSTLPALLERR